MYLLFCQLHNIVMIKISYDFVLLDDEKKMVMMMMMMMVEMMAVLFYWLARELASARAALAPLSVCSPAKLAGCAVCSQGVSATLRLSP